MTPSQAGWALSTGSVWLALPALQGHVPDAEASLTPPALPQAIRRATLGRRASWSWMISPQRRAAMSTFYSCTPPARRTSTPSLWTPTGAASSSQVSWSYTRQTTAMQHADRLQTRCTNMRKHSWPLALRSPRGRRSGDAFCLCCTGFATPPGRALTAAPVWRRHPARCVCREQGALCVPDPPQRGTTAVCCAVSAGV